MKSALVLLLTGCATIRPITNADPCPNYMDGDQMRSGAVQCRAMCASYGRELEAFLDDCRCVCKSEKRAPVTTEM